jgi:hypothetical protein
MKINRILIYTLFVLPALMMQSCLKDQEDIFEEGASKRIERYLSDTEKTLVSSENGWALDYYPGTYQEYGGYAYALKFTPDTVFVGYERSKVVGDVIPTLYRYKKDAGAVLSFDTYNTFMHEFATPSSIKYEADHGDFEFIIDSVGEDKVKLHDKRNGNIMYLRKLSKPYKQYLADLNRLKNNFMMINSIGFINGKAVNMSFNGSMATITIDNMSKEVPFTFTDEGIRFYQPIDLAGKTVWEMKYDASKNTLVAADDQTVVLSSLIYRLDNSAAQTTAHLAGIQAATVNPEAADWLHVSTSGEQLNINASENTTGHMRSATITVSLSDGSSQHITVSQCDLTTNIFGYYDLKFMDNEGAEQNVVAKVDNDPVTGGVRLGFKLQFSYYEYAVYFPAVWDKKTNSLVLTSGSYVGNLATYFLYSIFSDATGSQITDLTAGVEARFTFDYTEKPSGAGKTTATMNGSYTGVPNINGIWLLAFNTQSFVYSKKNFAGTLTQILAPVMTKQ